MCDVNMTSIIDFSIWDININDKILIENLQKHKR